MRLGSSGADATDLGLPCLVAVAAAWATWLPSGSALRVELCLLMLLFVPGHLASQRPAPVHG